MSWNNDEKIPASHPKHPNNLKHRERYEFVTPNGYRVREECPGCFRGTLVDKRDTSLGPDKCILYCPDCEWSSVATRQTRETS